MQPTFSYIYSLPYIALFLIFFILFLWENRIKRKDGNINVIRFFCCIIFLLFFGCRGYIDTDFVLYSPLYELSPTLDDPRGIAKFFSDINEDYILKVEPGYKIFMILLKSINPDYFFLQFISSLIDVFFLNYFFKKYSPQYALGFMMFFIFSGLIIELNLLRNSKAIFFFIYSLQYIKERKAVQFFICNGIGVLLHASAIFFFPVYFFLHKKIPAPVMWGLFLIGNLLYLGQVRYITPIVTSLGSLFGGVYSIMADAYSNDKLSTTGYGVTLGFLERLLAFVIFYWSYEKIVDYLQDRKMANILFNSFFIYLLMYLFLSEYSIFIDRMTTLFVFSHWLLYPYFYTVLSERAKSMFTFVLLFFGIFKMYKSNNIIIRNYENILWDKPSISKAYSILNKHLEKIVNPKK